MTTYASHHRVRTERGATYARWSDRISYKPGTSFTLFDHSELVGPDAVAEDQRFDYRLVLEIGSWVEDSSVAWGPADRADWESSVAGQYATDVMGHLSTARPLADYLGSIDHRVNRRMVRVALAKTLPPALGTFGDFVLAVRGLLSEMELHEMDEWIRIDEGSLPFDPHRPGDLSPQQWFAARQMSQDAQQRVDQQRAEQHRAHQRGPEPVLAWIDEAQRYFDTGKLDSLTPEQKHALGAIIPPPTS